MVPTKADQTLTCLEEFAYLSIRFSCPMESKTRTQKPRHRQISPQLSPSVGSRWKKTDQLIDELLCVVVAALGDLEWSSRPFKNQVGVC